MGWKKNKFCKCGKLIWGHSKSCISCARQAWCDAHKGFISGKRNPRYGLKECGKNNPNWKGGRVIQQGYIFIYKPNHPHCTKSGYVQEHRLKMEKKLGRYLKRSEVVHHINEDRQDNRLRNLYLCKNASEHLKLHKTSWVRRPGER